MKESPIFSTSGRRHDVCKTLKEAFTVEEFKLFSYPPGATAGQEWSGTRPVLRTLLASNPQGERHCRELVAATALLLAMPFFVVLGALSDRIGRKRIIMVGPAGGCLLCPDLSGHAGRRGVKRRNGSTIKASSHRSHTLTPQTVIDGAL